MKRCIWCNGTEIDFAFNKLAHTIPRSLGGKNTCENVCDNCNKFFGDKEANYPAIEIALKEVLNISKHIILLHSKEKPEKRFTSEYFDFNMTSYLIKHKMKYKLKSGFQEEFARRFKRGIYKIYLEERERQKKDTHDPRFDFVRAFSRYDLNDCPIYYLKPKFPILALSTEDTKNPQIRFTDYSEELDRQYKFYSYPFLGIIWLFQRMIFSGKNI